MNKQDMIRLARATFMLDLTEQLVNVQPMDPVLGEAFKIGHSEEEMRAEGYEPVSELNLMWVKK